MAGKNRVGLHVGGDKGVGKGERALRGGVQQCWLVGQKGAGELGQEG